ncbi:MAG: hypothetical protein AAFX54_04820 [Pseudomonadota bacterium]
MIQYSALRFQTLCFLAGLMIAMTVGAIASAKEPKPLFRDDSVLKLRIEAPFKELTRKAARSTDPYPATLILEGAAPEQLSFTLSARGKSRRNRNLCTFPPLRVSFDEKPGEASIFDGQKRLKLVTHCRGSNSYQQYYMLEYTAYKLSNALTPYSLKARMAEIDYVEADTGKVVASKFGFFIEDTDDAAKRNEMKEIDTPDIDVAQIAPSAAARYALFQYMIGNLDWSMHNGPDGNDCCHNTKLVGATAGAQNDLIPIAYDFDYSGLVDAPYAVAPEELRISSVRTRRYRGFCAHNEEARAQGALIRENYQAFYDAVNGVPTLSDRSRRSTTKYLDRFFEDIESDEQLEKRLLAACRD